MLEEYGFYLIKKGVESVDVFEISLLFMRVFYNETIINEALKDTGIPPINVGVLSLYNFLLKHSEN